MHLRRLCIFFSPSLVGGDLPIGSEGYILLLLLLSLRRFANCQITPFRFLREGRVREKTREGGVGGGGAGVLYCLLHIA